MKCDLCGEDTSVPVFRHDAKGRTEEIACRRCRGICAEALRNALAAALERGKPNHFERGHMEAERGVTWRCM